MFRILHSLLIPACIAVVFGLRSDRPGVVVPSAYVATDVEATAAATSDSVLENRGGFRQLQGYIPGLLSISGLPPLSGVLELTQEALIFYPDNQGPPVLYPVYRPTYHAEDSEIGDRRPSVRLMGVHGAAGMPVYLFHFDGAVFETASPGMLKDLAENPEWVDSLGATVSGHAPPLMDPNDRDALLEAVRALEASAYADTLFQLFGKPARPIGLVGRRGQSAGRLGEYIASRDSLSLSPGRMTHPGQLRHSLVHELAHRWQRRAADVLERIWTDVPPIRDSLRYGYGDAEEHQAEAIAFAVHYLQATARPDLTIDERAALLDAYERLVPGTRLMARYLLRREIYQQHPLAGYSLDVLRVSAAYRNCLAQAGARAQQTARPGLPCTLLAID